MNQSSARTAVHAVIPGARKAILEARRRWQTPEEMLQHIAKGLRKRVESKREELVCEQLTAVRNFSGWLRPLGVELH